MYPSSLCRCQRSARWYSLYSGSKLGGSSCIFGGAGACETAAALLGVADEAGLSHLRAVALDFVVMHFEAVAKTTAWASLPRACADAVAAEVRTPLNATAGCSRTAYWRGYCLGKNIVSATRLSWPLWQDRALLAPPQSCNVIALGQCLCALHAALILCICVQATSRFKHSMELMRKMTAQNKAAVQER